MPIPSQRDLKGFETGKKEKKKGENHMCTVGMIEHRYRLSRRGDGKHELDLNVLLS
jgi:hypothetical protein